LVGTDTVIPVLYSEDISSSLSTVTGEYKLEVGAISTSFFHFIRNIKYNNDIPGKITVTWTGGNETVRLMDETGSVQYDNEKSGSETVTIDLTKTIAGAYTFNFGGMGLNISKVFKIISPIIT
jgi:hypothetical protein